MVRPFQFARVPAIHFKTGIISLLPEFARNYGSRLIIVTGKNSFLKSTQAARLFEDLKKAGAEWQHVSIGSEPTPEMIDQEASKTADRKTDLVIGIGGGSALDAGKAISAMLYKKESVKEFLELTGTKTHPGTKIPYIAVPTTSGTGSEATKNAVLSNTGPLGFKRSLRHDNLVPDIALVDPELSINCPPDITAASGMDCFTQLTEAYLSDKSSAYSDSLAFAGLKAVKSSLVRSCKDGSDIEARSGMSFAALTSGICLANAGLGVVHGFASSLGARYDIPHGIICGTLMAPANEINIKLLRKEKNSLVLSKYVTLGKLFLAGKEGGDEYFIDGFIDYLYALSEEIKLPGLKSSGADDNDFPEIVKNTDGKNNPVKLSNDDLLEILLKRYF